MRAFRLSLLAIGILSLAIMIANIGVSTLALQLKQLSWKIGLLALFPFSIVTVLDTLAWRFAFRRNLPFRTLFPIRLAGEAVNMTTLSASLGGEAVKAYLRKQTVPLEEGLASVVIAKTTITVALGLFLLSGITLASGLLPGRPSLIRPMVGLVIFGGLAIGAFLILQQRGLFEQTIKLLRTLGIRWKRGESLLQRLDRAIKLFYQAHRARFYLSCLFHLLGWIAGSLEIYLALWLLGVPVSLGAAIVIEAFTQSIKAAAFLIPSGVGVQEGGLVAIFLAFGLGAGVGLTVGLVRRLRELTWITAGLVTLGLIEKLPSEQAA
jgi:uncharacterized protein (TIRG00374 family)